MIPPNFRKFYQDTRPNEIFRLGVYYIQGRKRGEEATAKEPRKGGRHNHPGRCGHQLLPEPVRLCAEEGVSLPPLCQGRGDLRPGRVPPVAIGGTYSVDKLYHLRGGASRQQYRAETESYEAEFYIKKSERRRDYTGEALRRYAGRSFPAGFGFPSRSPGPRTGRITSRQ